MGGIFNNRLLFKNNRLFFSCGFPHIFEEGRQSCEREENSRDIGRDPPVPPTWENFDGQIQSPSPKVKPDRIEIFVRSYYCILIEIQKELFDLIG